MAGDDDDNFAEVLGSSFAQAFADCTNAVMRASALEYLGIYPSMKGADARIAFSKVHEFYMDRAVESARESGVAPEFGLVTDLMVTVLREHKLEGVGSPELREDEYADIRDDLPGIFEHDYTTRRKFLTMNARIDSDGGKSDAMPDGKTLRFFNSNFDVIEQHNATPTRVGNFTGDGIDPVRVRQVEVASARLKAVFLVVGLIAFVHDKFNNGMTALTRTGMMQSRGMGDLFTTYMRKHVGSLSGSLLGWVGENVAYAGVTTTADAVRHALEGESGDFQYYLSNGLLFTGSAIVGLMFLQSIARTLFPDMFDVRSQIGAAVEAHICDVCTDKAVYRCSACRTATYCSERCQADGFITHKHICSMLE